MSSHLPAPARARLAALFGVDERSLALFRILLGGLLVADLLLRCRDFGAHYTDEGVLPRSGLLDGVGNTWHFCLHLLGGSWHFAALLHGVHLGFALALTLGYRTRWATLGAWVLLCSLQERNPLILQASDTLLRMGLFWMLFLPTERVASLDRGGWAGARTVTSVATVAVLVQQALVYLLTAILKDGYPWLDGTAVFLAVSLDQYRTPLGAWLADQVALCRWLTYATLAFEFTAPLLLFFPLGTPALRVAVVAGLVVMQVGFNVCLKLGLFPFIACASLVVFLPGALWDRIGWTQGAWPRLGRWAEGRWTGAPGQFAAAVALFLVVVWNLGTPKPPFWKTTDAIRVPVHLARLDQNWGMFAPYPLTEDGWYVIPGHLRGGREVDLFRGGAPVSWEKPEAVSSLFLRQRWRKYFTNMWKKKYASNRLWWGRWMCREWNAVHHGPDVLQDYQIVYMLEETRRPGQAVSVMRKPIWTGHCFPKAPSTGG